MAPEISDDVFPNANKTTLHNPGNLTEEEFEQYRTAPGWKNFFRYNYTAVENIESDFMESGEPKEYFLLTGQKVVPASLIPGIYIMRQGGRSSKIFYRGQ